MSLMLLVGGLGDGQRREIPAEHQYCEIPVFASPIAGLPDTRIITRTERYRRTLMCHMTVKGREFIEFFRLATLSEYDALRLLVLNYPSADQGP